MEFRWWWILVALAAVWVAGWCVSVLVMLFFNPLDSDEDKRQDFRNRLLGACVINWLLWPWLLSGILERRKLYRDMRTGKRPNWIIFGEGERDSRQWTLSDGTEFQGRVSNGSKSEPTIISADYEDRELQGLIEYRVRMIAPPPGPPTDWTSLDFSTSRPVPDADPEDEDEEDDDDYVPDRYEVSIQIPRGKHAIEFRVPNRSGGIEECSALTVIVAEPEDYNL